MRTFRCHKVVNAAQIACVSAPLNDGTYDLTLVDDEHLGSEITLVKDEISGADLERLVGSLISAGGDVLWAHD